MLMGLALCAGLVMQCRQPSRDPVVSAAPVEVEIVPTAAVISDSMSEPERLARENPLRFFHYCVEQYDRHVRDYRVTFTKQEELHGKLALEQVTNVRFREQPFSVDMAWTRNAGRAARVLYVKGQRVDDQGHELALIKPAGIIGGLGIKVERDVRGKDATREHRRTIDQFGFRNTLELIIKYSEEAKASGKLDLRYVGEGSLAGRPTYVFERRLPYDKDGTHYPDRLLIVHVDKELLLPTGCFSYADDAGQELLGKYLLTDVHLNLGYQDADFDPQRINF